MAFTGWASACLFQALALSVTRFFAQKHSERRN
jgi:hypothetical protein